MGSLSIWHWLVVLAWFAGVGIPVANILQRTGKSRWWTVLAFLPLVNILALWLFAYSPWRTSQAADTF